MKKLLYAVLLLFFVVTAHAQRVGVDFKLGLTAHPTFGWMRMDGVKGEGASTGFSYGLLGDFNFAENYSFATGVLITTVNSKFNYDLHPVPTHLSVVAPPSDLKYKVQYVILPLTIKLSTSKENTIRAYGQFGLSNGFRTSAKIRNYSQDTERDTDAISFYRAGLVIGGGAEYPVAKSATLTGGISFDNGITNISGNAPSKVKNNYISVNIGIFF